MVASTILQVFGCQLYTSFLIKSWGAVCKTATHFSARIPNMTTARYSRKRNIQAYKAGTELSKRPIVGCVIRDKKVTTKSEVPDYLSNINGGLTV